MSDAPVIPTPPIIPKAPINLSRQTKSTNCMKSTVARHLKSAQGNDDICQTAEEETRELWTKMPKMESEDQKDKIFISCRKWKIKPVIQEGPQCGLVAISMIAKAIRGVEYPPDHILQEAQTRGYTKRGEMFSATNLLNLANHFLDCTGCVVTGDLRMRKLAIIRHLLQGHLIIIPYDRYHNNEPCLKKGIKAHWAVLSGVFWISTENDVPNLPGAKDSIQDQLYHLKPTQNCKGADKLEALSKHSAQIYVFGNQGKSLRTQLWDLEILLKSNEQLCELDPDIIREIDNYHIPDGGIEEGLNNKVVVVIPQDS